MICRQHYICLKQCVCEECVLRVHTGLDQTAVCSSLSETADHVKYVNIYDT